MSKSRTVGNRRVLTELSRVKTVVSGGDKRSRVGQTFTGRGGKRDNNKGGEKRPCNVKLGTPPNARK